MTTVTSSTMVPRMNDTEGTPQIALTSFSIVITGTYHNPTILNPDFLRVQDIVKPQWEWAVADPAITTPPLSIVRYTNGVTISVEVEKLQVVDLHSGPASSRVVEIVKQYIRTLPHVRYTAVGTNFQVTIQLSQPENFLKSRFLKPGPWDTPERPLQALGLRLLYALPSAKLILALDLGDTGVLIANANFHRDCSAYPATEQIYGHLDSATSDWAQFRALLKDTIGGELA